MKSLLPKFGSESCTEPTQYMNIVCHHDRLSMTGPTTTIVEYKKATKLCQDTIVTLPLATATVLFYSVGHWIAPSWRRSCLSTPFGPLQIVFLLRSFMSLTT